MTVSRRDALKLGGMTVIGGGALALAVDPLGLGGEASALSISRLSAANFPKPYTTTITKIPAAVPQMINGVAHYEFSMRRNPLGQILPGPLKTPVFGYEGTFPGPRIDLRRGTPATIRHHNKLPVVGSMGSPAHTSVHLHGSASLPEFDGYASDTTAPGEYKDYHYPNFQAARTLWYHDHGVHWTAQQAYGGLAAMYVLHDKEESTLLPTGDFDIPLVINDAMFARDGSLAYNDNTHSGLWGDVILVNGKPWPKMRVERRAYRFRILNCSISRSYRWRLSNGMPLQVVATDGGVMPQGVAVSTMRHGGAERYEVVIDFSKVPTNIKRIELLNDSNPNNRNYDFTNKVMAFDLIDPPTGTSVTKTRANYDTGALEPDPTWNRDYNGFKLVDSDIMSIPTTGNYTRRKFTVKRSGGMWQFGDTTWLDVEASDFTRILDDPSTGGPIPAIDDVEIWDIENKSGGWFHPVHIHLVDFRIIGRTGSKNGEFDGPQPWEQGPKDVMYVGEGETVTVLIKFIKGGGNVAAPHGDPGFVGGRYMVHCHNLPHEDHDMMGQFQVGTIADYTNDPHHPISAAPPQPEPV